MPKIPTKIIEPKDLINIAEFCDGKPVTIDNVYAKETHPNNNFLIDKKAIYRDEYKNDKAMWVYKDLAKIVRDATKYIPSGYRLSLKDSLRTADAQKAMELAMRQKYDGLVVPSSLVSGAGQGAHPRGMAVDIMLEKFIDGKWVEVPVGTNFDFFDVKEVEIDGKKTLAANDPPRSSRLYFHLNPDKDPTGEIRKNQRILERAMMRAALDNSELIMPLEDEHWDFRFPNAPTSLQYVLKSIARIIGVEIPLDKNIETKHIMTLLLWNELFDKHKNKLEEELGVKKPPEIEPTYSLEYFPLMDRDLPEKMRVTEGLQFDALAIQHIASSDAGLGFFRPTSATKSYSASVNFSSGAGAVR